MFYSYVIKSLKSGALYKGHCENIGIRLEQHNKGMTQSIKNNGPFEITYFEEFMTREEAIKREKYFKSAAGRRYLNKKMVL